jgi:amino acid transporter
MSKQAKIGFWAAVLMNINIIVGAGILFSPGPMARLAGSVSFLSWLFVGLLVFPVIWCIAQAPRLFPGDGGFYNYCSKGINPTVGFIAQWLYLIGYIGTALVMLIVIKDVLANKIGLTLVAEYPLLVNAVLITFFSLLNLLPVSVVSKLQGFATVLKLMPVLLAIGLLPFYFNTGMSYDLTAVPTLAMTLPLAIFAFWGFEACASIGSLLKDGPQSVGKVVLTAFFITVGLYSAFHFSVMHIMGVNNLAAQGPIAFPAFLGFAPGLTQALSWGVLVAIAFSYMNSLFGVLLGNMTNFYMVVKNKLIAVPACLAETNKNDRPVYVAALLGALVFALSVYINFEAGAVALTNVGVSAAFVLTLVAMLCYYWKKHNFVQLFITLLGCASCGMLIYFSWISISPNELDRVLYTSPLLVGLVLGLVLKYFAPSKKAVRK